MAERLLLFPSLSLLLFFVGFVIGGILFLSGLFFSFIARKKKLLLAYVIAIFLALLLTLSGYVALFALGNSPIALYFFYAPLLPLPLAIVCLIREKNALFAGDIVAFLLLSPLFYFSSYSAISYGLGVLYFNYRALSFFSEGLWRLKEGLTPYTIKKCLDDLPWGLLLANKDKKIVYINNAFLSLLFEESIDVHEKEDVVFLSLRKGCFREIDSSSFIVYREGDGYLLLRERYVDGNPEISFHDVKEEVLLTQSIQRANEELQEEQTLLREKLDAIQLASQEEERKRLRRLLHDSFAEEVSFIHQILSNPSLQDLQPLKEVVNGGLANYEITYADVQELEKEYSSLGLSFLEEGDLATCPDPSLLLEILQEASDNAIRHGGAHQIRLVSSLGEGGYTLLIENDGEIPLAVSPHGGLSNLRERLEEAGGHLTVQLTPHFALSCHWPLPRKND